MHAGRVILLIDMNAFFFMCEASVNPDLKGRAAAVAGDPQRRSGIILSASYEARKMGVRTTMTIREAREICPEIVLVPPTHGLYDSKSRQVMAILSRFTPVIQQASIDEAWLDMTGSSGLFGEPATVASKIMETMKSESDLWCSIGISYNKFLAKMACEMKKPLGITELWPDDVPVKLWPLPVGDMYGIGKKTASRLNELAIFTIGDLAVADIGALTKVLGKSGAVMRELANGTDDSPVTEFPVHSSKSTGRSTTLANDITDIVHAKSVIRDLAEDVGEDARKLGMPGRTVSIVIKYSDFKSITRQCSVTPTHLTKEIYEAGAVLLEKSWDRKKPVRLLGISLGGMEKGIMLQPDLFDSEAAAATETTHQAGRAGIIPGGAGAATNTVGVTANNGYFGRGSRMKEDKLEKAIDRIRDRFGSDKIRRASAIKPHDKKHSKGPE